MFNRLFKSEHQRVEEMLSAYLDGELSPKEQARAERHLAQCADCAQNLHTLRQTTALLGQLPPVAVPRAFTVRPTQVAQRARLLQTRRTYGYLRAATALATVLLAVVLASDAFLIGQVPYLTPARAPEVVEREVPVEKVVVRTVVVEKEVAITVEVEKEVVVEKEMVVEAPIEAPALESQPAYEATPSPAPAEDRGQLVGTPKPLPTPGVAAKEMKAAGTPPTVEEERLAEAPPSPGAEQVEVTPMPTPPLTDTVVATEPVFTPTAMPTAVVQALPPTPLPHEPTSPVAVRLGQSGLTVLRVIEVGLIMLVLVLAVATLITKRRQNIGRR